jgi:hypothetical protein
VIKRVRKSALLVVCALIVAFFVGGAAVQALGSPPVDYYDGGPYTTTTGSTGYSPVIPWSALGRGSNNPRLVTFTPSTPNGGQSSLPYQIATFKTSDLCGVQFRALTSSGAVYVGTLTVWFVEMGSSQDPVNPNC